MRPVQHTVDGKPMTVPEIARMLGTTAQALHDQRHRFKGIDMQALVDKYRSGEISIKTKTGARHDVDGKRMTVPEIAEMLGVSTQGLYTQKARRKGMSMQRIVDMYRSGEIGIRTKPAALHCVHGEWMTIAQAAAMVGTTIKGMETWRSKHRDANGRRALVETAVDHYKAVQAGHIKTHVGRPGTGRRYWVHGRKMTIADASAKMGLPEASIRQYVYRHKCNVQRACDQLLALKQERAEREIMKILNGEVD